jgi:hypothetical protein
MGYFQVCEKEKKLSIVLGGGFFSWCSVKLDNIIFYFNKYKELPQIIDNSLCFPHYKNKEHKDMDITNHFFTEDNDVFVYNYDKTPEFHYNHQYKPYFKFDYMSYMPFIHRYFQPSEKIKNIINEIESKYQIDVNNTICVYYRNTDKKCETPIASHDEFINKTSEILSNNINMKIICMTDDIKFENLVIEKFKDNIIIIDEVSKSMDKWDKRELKGRNYEHGLYMLACVYILSKCHSIICGSGNVSLWLALFRGNGKNIHQNLKLEWV